MTNPPPRPALRKAPDAEVHPALPRPALTPVRPVHPDERHGAAPATPAPLAVPLTTFGSSATSDVLRPVPDPPASPTSRKPGKPRKPGKGDKHGRTKHHGRASRAGRSKDAAAIAVPRRAEKDKTVVVEVPMPKSLRNRLDAQAEVLGYTREEAVLLLLRAWIDG